MNAYFNLTAKIAWLVFITVRMLYLVFCQTTFYHRGLCMMWLIIIRGFVAANIDEKGGLLNIITWLLLRCERYGSIVPGTHCSAAHILRDNILTVHCIVFIALSNEYLSSIIVYVLADYNLRLRRGKYCNKKRYSMNVIT